MQPTPEIWAEIVAARMTGDPMPFDAEVWMTCINRADLHGYDTQWQRAYCWAWQQGRYASLNHDGSPRLGTHFNTPSELTDIANRYRAAMIAKYRPAEVEENADE